MPDHNYADSIESMKKYFDTSTKCFEEGDAQFAPKPEMFTVAQQIAHAAQTVEWFVDGAFNPAGMATEFEASEKGVRKVTSLIDARAWMDRACKKAIDTVAAHAKAEFDQPIAGTIMAGEPRRAIFEAMTDHTAHHRGALAVYARLLGKVPPMPYA
ncbi:MAG TPA: DinB family protein [Planctomycetota bacterium]|nr:DinB family protein [Planctomycetota bacterium]